MKVLQSPLPDEKNPFEFYSHFGRYAALGENEDKSWWQKLSSYTKSKLPVFTVKPLLVIYMMSWAVTDSVGTQLWIDKTCRVNLNFTDAVCDDLTSPENNDANNKVQALVNTYKLYANYIDDVPQMLISLYLGPLSDSGRKPIMAVPFLGHIISGSLMILNIVYNNWDARLLWLSEVYVFFGGYSLLSIAMYGYIGDVTSAKERTAIIAILGALGFVMMPLADFCGGQIYKAGGFLPVYITSLSFVFVGLFYIWMIPESITARSHTKTKDIEDEGTQEENNDKKENVFQRIYRFFTETNKLLLETFKYVFSKREHGERGVIMGMLALSFIGSMRSRDVNGLLYTQKKFGWTVTNYTNYNSFFSVHIALKGFIVMPFLCYVLQVHDCVISIMGSLSGIEEYLVWAFATKGWHMYFGSALSALSGSRGTPALSILSKCVPSSQLGKIFSLFAAFQILMGMAMSYFNTWLYNATLTGFLGASYCLSAAFELLNMFGMALIYWYIAGNERKHGPLGQREESKQD